MPKLTDKLAGVRPPPDRKPPRKGSPLWCGPEADGVTFSMLSRFLVCRERFRLLVVEGLRPAPSFNHHIEYGHMWHTCEQALAAAAPTRSPGWEEALADYCRGLLRRYPAQAQQVDHWYHTCRTQFPLYVDYWSKHPDVVDRRPLMQEQVFNVPYQLPSGRTVRLRGKFDAVDLINAAPACTCGADRTGPSAEAHSTGCPAGAPRTVRGSPGVYLQENKTKSDIREGQVQRQLSFDLQTMLYLVALTYDTGIEALETVKMEVGKGDMPAGRSASAVRGVRYNVVRRPFGGGKGDIRRKKPTKKNPTGESKEAFYARLAGTIKTDPGSWFMRWKVEVTPDEVTRFRCECLDPILEQLCDWWNWVRDAGRSSPFAPQSDGGVGQTFGQITTDYNHIHWRHPFGVYNPLNEGGATDLDEYLASGSHVGLVRVDDLYPELTEPEVKE